MNHILLSAAVCFCLVGCASTAGSYGPANGSNLGYSNTKIENDRFRISYTSREANESQDFALLRAAQIAENEGYSHFKIIGGGAYDNGSKGLGANIGIGIGIGIGRGRYNRSNVNIGVSDIFRTLEGQKITETIEVILMTAPPADDPDVFSAESVIKNIIPSKIDAPNQTAP